MSEVETFFDVAIAYAVVLSLFVIATVVVLARVAQA